MRLIDADKLLECYEGLDKYHVPVGVIRANIDDMPTVEAEPVRHGKFVGRVLHTVWAIRRCSECHEYVPMSNYCPCCGAKMDEVEGGVNDAE